jgi:hypothetical protein
MKQHVLHFAPGAELPAVQQWPMSRHALHSWYSLLHGRQPRHKYAALITSTKTHLNGTGQVIIKQPFCQYRNLNITSLANPRTKNASHPKALNKKITLLQSRGSSVSIVTKLRASWLEFDSRQGQWRDVWAHPTSYRMGTGGSYPSGKAAGTWSTPLVSI